MKRTIQRFAAAAAVGAAVLGVVAVAVLAAGRDGGEPAGRNGDEPVAFGPPSDECTDAYAELTATSGTPVAASPTESITSTGDNVTGSARALVEEYGVTYEQAVRQLENQALSDTCTDGVEAALDSDPRFGGLWIDNAAGSVLVIAVTDPVLRAELATYLAPVEQWAGLQFVSPQYTLADIQAATDQLITELDLRASDRADQPAPGRFIQITPLVQDQRIVVKVSTSAPPELRTRLDSVVAELPVGLVTITEVDHEFRIGGD